MNKECTCKIIDSLILACHTTKIGYGVSGCSKTSTSHCNISSGFCITKNGSCICRLHLAAGCDIIFCKVEVCFRFVGIISKEATSSGSSCYCAFTCNQKISVDTFGGGNDLNIFSLIIVTDKSACIGFTRYRAVHTVKITLIVNNQCKTCIFIHFAHKFSGMSIIP